MPLTVQVWSDFVCPFCMIAEKPLHDAIEASGLEVTIEWMPFELRPYPTPTLRPEESYLQTVWPQSVYPLAEQVGIAIKLPSVSPQPHTGLAWEGYQFAREQGKGNAYNDRMLKAFFQENQDIGDIAVLSRLAQEIGLNQRAFQLALEQRTFREQHQRALAQARAMGVSSVPTFVIGPHRFSGVQSKELLSRALQDAARSLTACTRETSR
jgi:predicted DsbA family dithiol-disulfide isomerase